ncbi:MAG TPA: sensor histidine kinase [Eubacterium sp.]|nr:sensor histidine kinase [Eubacterium sp.]
MAKTQNKPHLTNFIKQNYIWILMIVTMSCIHLLYMYLIGARKQDVVYAAVLDAIMLLITVLVGFFRYRSKVKALSNALKRPVEEQAQLPEATDDVEILYHRLLENQSIARSESESSAAVRQSQMRDYYSMWVHQIKTPISAMKLLLEAEREELGQLMCDEEQQAAFKELSDNMDSFEDELFRIEEYVSMALQYQRVSSTENDFVLEKVSVDGVIRDTIKKYAKIMIRRHIGINYSGTGQEVYTDVKWLAFMLEQILSNAIKYTPQGGVTIETAEEKDRFFITIKDTGIGIKTEDLPRVFEKGYTGYNGHADKKATGIGLYLCRQMADKLGHTIRMESEIGKGTKVWIGFDLDYADTRD